LGHTLPGPRLDYEREAKSWALDEYRARGWPDADQAEHILDRNLATYT
jgi:hypothetical protein